MWVLIKRRIIAIGFSAIAKIIPNLYADSRILHLTEPCDIRATNMSDQRGKERRWRRDKTVLGTLVFRHRTRALHAAYLFWNDLAFADDVVNGAFLSPHCIIAVTDWLNIRADSLASA